MLDEFDTEVTEDELRTLVHGKHAKKIQSSARGKAAKAEIKQKAKLKDEETDRLVRKAQDKREIAMESFARYDRDGSGTITFKELGPLLTDVLRQHGCTKNLDAKTLEECFEKADTNHDNRIDFEEFVVWHNQTIAWGRRMNELERLAQEKQDKEDSAKYINTPEATAMVYNMLLASGDAKAALEYKHNYKHSSAERTEEESKDNAEWQQNEFIREFEAEERRQRNVDSLSLNEMQFSIFVEMAFGTAERHFSATLFKIFVRDTIQRKQSTSKQGALIFDELCVALRALKSPELDVIEIIEQYKSGPTETDLLRLVNPYVVT
eukprot:jgi/Chrpa1/21849/Chrysochromulina_OHIO_Genome00024647-RA